MVGTHERRAARVVVQGAEQELRQASGVVLAHAPWPSREGDAALCAQQLAEAGALLLRRVFRPDAEAKQARDVVAEPIEDVGGREDRAALGLVAEEFEQFGERPVLQETRERERAAGVRGDEVELAQNVVASDLMRGAAHRARVDLDQRADLD